MRERRSFSVCVCFVMALSAQTLGRGRRAFSLRFHGWDDRDMSISCLALVSPDVGVFKDSGGSQIWQSRWIVADIETLALSADANVMIYQV